MNPNMFKIVYNVNTFEPDPPSPMEIAYRFIEAWLGLADFQSVTTSEATKEYILDLGDASEDEIKSFQEFWRVEVVQGKQIPAVAAQGKLKSVKLGAANDQGLYLEYTKYQLQLIALAFALSGRDFNIGEHDNRATSKASADSTFASAVRPMAEIVDEALDSEVIDYYLPGFKFSRTYTEPRSEAELSEQSREDYKTGVITRNEARKARGYDPVEGGDEFVSPQKNSALPIKSDQGTEEGIID